VSSLLGCDSIAILPENMSRERFEWLEKVAGEVIATPGCESNVKEIFDKCWELKNTRKDPDLQSVRRIWKSALALYGNRQSC